MLIIREQPWLYVKVQDLQAANIGLSPTISHTGIRRPVATFRHEEAVASSFLVV